MNSKNKVSKLGRNKGHRKTVIRNLLNNIVIYEHMQTTPAKAKVVLANFDRLIKIAKTENKLNAERELKTILFDKAAVLKVIDVFSKRFKDQTTGLINMYKLANRKGDNSPMVMLIVKGYEYKDFGKKAAVKKKKEAAKVKSTVVKELERESKITSKSQVDVKAAQGKSKSRSGI